MERDIQKESEKESWVNEVGVMREIQNEDGSFPARITGWSLSDDEERVELELSVEGLDEEFVEPFIAPSEKNTETELERLMDELGYDIWGLNTLDMDSPTVPAVRSQAGQWRIDQQLYTDSEELGGKETPSWVKSSVSNKKKEPLLFLFFGCILGPVMALFLYHNSLDSGFTSRTIGASMVAAMINCVIVGFLIGSML